MRTKDLILLGGFAIGGYLLYQYFKSGTLFKQESSEGTPYYPSGDGKTNGNGLNGTKTGSKTRIKVKIPALQINVVSGNIRYKKIMETVLPRFAKTQAGKRAIIKALGGKV